MKAVLLASAILATLFSTAVLSETTESLILTIPAEETKKSTDDSGIDLGPVDMTVESSNKKEPHVNIGFKKKIGNITYFTSTERLLDDLEEVTSLSAGISWKF